MYSPKFPAITWSSMEKCKEFFFEKWEFSKKEFPLLLNRKWELKWELYVGIVDKQNLIGLEIIISEFIFGHTKSYLLDIK